MNKLFVTCLLAIAGIVNWVQAAPVITGAGSSFVYPVLSQWVQAYQQHHPLRIQYQVSSSVEGVSALAKGKVNFAASDIPLTRLRLRKLAWRQFPLAISGIVPVINVPGINSNQLVLSGRLLAAIYLGNIKYWDAKAIKKINPSLSLPHLAIISLHRGDASGTTYNFTNYLSQVSATWRDKIGFASQVRWPGTDNIVNGSPAMAQRVKMTKGAIGYLKFAYAKRDDLALVKLINRDHKLVKANLKTFSAAVKQARWRINRGYYKVLNNQRGIHSWPIVATTFILLPRKMTPLTLDSLHFFAWCFQHGDKIARNLDYVPLPSNVYRAFVQVS